MTSFLATDLSSFNYGKIQWYITLHARRGTGTHSSHSLLPMNTFVRQDSIDGSHSLLNIMLGEHLREEGEREGGRERERGREGGEREGERERGREGGREGESMSYPIRRLHSTYQWDGMLSMKILGQ